MSSRFRTATRVLVGGLGTAAAGYAALVTLAWARYGRVPAPRGEERDPLLDEFLPVYDVVERHHIRVAAPAPVTFAAACETDLQGSALVRAIFRAREVLLGATSGVERQPQGIIGEMRALGWGVLKNDPGHEIVMGAVTKPWETNVVFRALPAGRFKAFNDPGFVKIVWTLRADPVSSNESVFRTETRAVATDHDARVKFRRYWSLFSHGIILIRWALLGPVKAEAERRGRKVALHP